MEKEFIPYEQALALKQLGFDEPCLGYFFENKLYTEDSGDVVKYFKSDLDAPLYQQAFRWFREKYYLVSWVRRRPGFVKEYSWYVSDFNDEDPDKYYFDIHIETYEEAELECFKKLIEIVKEK